MNSPQLYLLTNDDEFALLYDKLEQAMATGVVSLLQIRRKSLLNQANGKEHLINEAKKLLKLAQNYNVTMLMNDDMHLAKDLGMGVHLGLSDGEVSEARALLGAECLIGRTCHHQLELVQQAHQDKASYAAMGAVFPSTTKPNANLVNHQQIASACQQGIDICVIGGLTAENIRQLAGLPIRYVAVVGDILNRPLDQIAKRCQQWQQVFENWSDGSV